MRISSMVTSTALSGAEYVPVYDPNQSTVSQQNRKVNVELFQGLQGERGFQGLSAYQSWLNIGNTGTETDFINSIKGAAGTDGVNGTNGESAYQSWLDVGNTGTEQDFVTSLKGESAYQVWLDLGNTGSSQDFINSLTGPQGLSDYDIWLSAGHTGTEDDFITYITGLSAYQIWLQAGNSGTENDFLASLVGQNGATGGTGPQGPQGTIGPQGPTGAHWYNGAGAPSSGLGANNDYYLNDTNGDVYQKLSGSWGSPVANIVGPAGSGVVGSIWYNGSGVPSSGTGINGDYYLNDTNGDVYHKVSGSWGSPIANIVGPTGTGTPGSVWYNGSGVPSSGTGINGDYYLNDDNGDIYHKVSGSWGSPTGNIEGPTGSGAGVAAGGSAGQLLVKLSGADYDTGWIEPPGLILLDQPVICTFPNTSGVWMNADFSTALANVDSSIPVTAVLVVTGILAHQNPCSVYARADSSSVQQTLLSTAAYGSGDQVGVQCQALAPTTLSRGCQVYVKIQTDSGSSGNPYDNFFTWQVIGYLTTPITAAAVTTLTFSGSTPPPSGGGYGGGCVMTYMYLKSDITADIAYVGMSLYGMDEDTYEFLDKPIVSIRDAEMQPCIWIVMTSGAELGFSTTTPLCLEDHTTIMSSELKVGMKLPVRIGEENAIPYWDTVESISEIGLQLVRPITNKGVYAAGSVAGKYIYTHNISKV